MWQIIEGKSVNWHQPRNDRDGGMIDKDAKATIKTIYKYLQENMNIMRRDMEAI